MHHLVAISGAVLLSTTSCRGCWKLRWKCLMPILNKRCVSKIAMGIGAFA